MGVMVLEYRFMVLEYRFIEGYVFVFCSLDCVFLILGFHFGEVEFLGYRFSWEVVGNSGSQLRMLGLVYFFGFVCCVFQYISNSACEGLAIDKTATVICDLPCVIMVDQFMGFPVSGWRVRMNCAGIGLI
ncbi:hypothetical protein M758_2G196700 [Ceratodon purpureus]|nr:hypothetical protein M758_2G196700 [Ceratodon purpureus]